MNSEFAKPTEELERVAKEIDSLRRELLTLSGTLSRIEKRLKGAFPNYPAVKGKKLKKSISTRSGMSNAELQQLFSHLVEITQRDGDGAYSAKANDIETGDLFALADELGISSSRRTSRPKAIESIRKRVQEAMQLQFMPLLKG